MPRSAKRCRKPRQEKRHGFRLAGPACKPPKSGGRPDCAAMYSIPSCRRHCVWRNPDGPCGSRAPSCCSKPPRADPKCDNRHTQRRSSEREPHNLSWTPVRPMPQQVELERSVWISSACIPPRPIILYTRPSCKSDKSVFSPGKICRQKTRTDDRFCPPKRSDSPPDFKTGPWVSCLLSARRYRHEPHVGITVVRAFEPFQICLGLGAGGMHNGIIDTDGIVFRSNQIRLYTIVVGPRSRSAVLLNHD